MSLPTRAIIFDLFGTLVTYPPGARHVHAMAAALGVDLARLHAEWRKLRPQRDGGELDTRGALRVCSEALGLEPTPAQLDAACAAVVTFFEGLLVPRAGALQAIARLRDRGLRIGLLSDANVEVARLWPGCALGPLVDVAVFSCEEHVRKPDPGLYEAVCGRLTVAPGECLYVGNGDGEELAGAVLSGMRALLFTAPGELPGREAETWQGPWIDDLAQVAAFVESATSPAAPRL